MAKKQNKKSSKKAQKGQLAPRKRAALGGLDAGALAYRELLMDPCNGPLARPVYAGSGSGYITRIRQFVNPAADDVDYLLSFMPSYRHSTTGFSNVSAVTGWGKNVAGANIDACISYSIPFIMDSATVGTARCLAACIKVHYTGSELNRQGMVYKGLGNQLVFSPTGTGKPVANTCATVCQSMERMPAGHTEARWLPEVTDEEFEGFQRDATSVSGQYGNALVVGITNATPGKFMFEIISVWEWTPGSSEGVGSAGIVTAPTSPPSHNTTNQVLRTLGNIGQFVAGHLPPGFGSMAVRAGMGMLGIQYSNPNNMTSAPRIGWR